MGTDASRISPALLSLIDEEIERYGVPWRIDGAINAAVSVLAAMTVDEHTTRAELALIEAPTLVLWGNRERVIPRRLVDELRVLHPAWEFRTVDGSGHLLPLEAPQIYVELVADWMRGRTERPLARPAPSDDALEA